MEKRAVERIRETECLAALQYVRGREYAFAEFAGRDLGDRAFAR
jgi:hypothetical protein